MIAQLGDSMRTWRPDRLLLERLTLVALKRRDADASDTDRRERKDARRRHRELMRAVRAFTG